jgi:hypothetical protein
MYYNVGTKGGNRRCFPTVQEAWAWADRQVELWVCQGAIAPVYRVDYMGTYIDREGRPEANQQ